MHRVRRARKVLDRAIGSEPCFDDVILSLLRHLSGWTSCACVGIRLRRGDDFVLVKGVGYRDEFIYEERSLLTEADEDVGDFEECSPLLCLCGAVLSGKALRGGLQETSSGSYWTNDLQALSSTIAVEGDDVGVPLRGSCVHAGFRSQAWIPLRVERRRLGLLMLHDEEAGLLDEELLLFLEDVAAHLALVLALREAEAERLVSLEGLRQLSLRLQDSLEAERQGIAREIHDELGQALTALKIDAGFVASRLPEGEGALRERLGDMVSLVDGLAATVRRISTDLRPPELDHLGLPAAIAAEVASFERRTGVVSTFHRRVDDLDLSPGVAMSLFRVLQEALTNVARHARATTVDVELQRRGDLVLLRVVDDGEGMSTEVPLAVGSLGLLGMRERLAHLGGQVRVVSSPGGGTALVITAPVNALAGG